MVEFITEGLNRGGNYGGGGRWSSFPLYFNSERVNHSLAALFNIDASIVIEELPPDSGKRYIRRNQTHNFFNNRRPPEFTSKVTPVEYRCLLAWHIANYTYAQGRQIEYNPSFEYQAYRGSHQGRGIWEKWFPEDKVYKNESVNLRFLWQENKGEPADFELRLLLNEKQRRYNEFYSSWARGESSRKAAYDEETARLDRERRDSEFSDSNNNRRRSSSARGAFQGSEFRLEDYVGSISRYVDIRSWRPVTKEKLYRMSNADVFYYEGNTKTVEKIVLDMLDRMLNPREERDFGVTRGNSVLFSLVNTLPSRQEGEQGAALFNHTINVIKRDIRQKIILEPYGILAGQTI